jgi:membrane protease YdiL (CAAX protease family)
MDQPRAGHRVAAFLILFLLYQSAEGVGGRLLQNFAVQASLMTLALLAAWPVGRWLLQGRGYRAYALEPRRDLALLLGGALLLAFAAKAAALALGLGLGIYRLAPAQPAAPAAATAAGTVLFLMLSTFIPSLAEDILTRGFWYRFGPWRSGARFLVLSSAVYVTNHIYRLDKGPVEWLTLFAFGLAYAAALLRTGSLWAALGLHWGWNLANALLDSFTAIDTANPAAAPALSLAAHLTLAAAILAWPTPRPPRQSDSPIPEGESVG